MRGDPCRSAFDRRRRRINDSKNSSIWAPPDSFSFRQIDGLIRAARGETIVTIDSDLQNDPADIPRLLEEISRGADLVCGYRAKRKDTLTKRLTSRIANFVRSRFTKDYVRDTGCTLKAMRRQCANALVPFKGMHRFIPALIRGAGYRLVEIPVNHRPRRFGQTKYGFGSRALRATIDMFGVRWLLSRRLNYKIRGS